AHRQHRRRPVPRHRLELAARRGHGLRRRCRHAGVLFHRRALHPMGDAMVRLQKVLPAAFLGLVVAYLYAPIAVIVIFSFTPSPRLSMPIEGLPLSWYASALSNPLMSTALRNSLALAAVSAILSGAMGAAFAFGLVALKRLSLRLALLMASLLPAIVPLL